MKRPPKIRIVSSPGIADEAKKDKIRPQAKIGGALRTPRGIQACLWVALGLVFVFLYVFNYTTLF